jgi:hypothetical protein
MIFKDDNYDTVSTSCNHHLCNQFHILNNFRFNFKEITQKHIETQEKFAEFINKHTKLRKEEIITKRTINLIKHEEPREIA